MGFIRHALTERMSYATPGAIGYVFAVLCVRAAAAATAALIAVTIYKFLH